MTTNSINRPGTLHTADAPLPVLYREYADAVAREALRGDCACRRCGGSGWEDCYDYDLEDSLAAAVYAEDRAAVCGWCDGEGFAPAPICNRCGEAVYSRCPDRDGCCETCAPGLLPYRQHIADPDQQPGADDVETVYHASWPEACAALTALLPDADLRAGYWGRVTDPRTGITCYRDALCLD